MRVASGRPWGVMLAGGDGIRLRPLTVRIAGDERPKQFCRIVGRHTLVEQTERRLAIAVPPERRLVVLTRAHESFYGPVLGGMTAAPLVQPRNRGTAPAVLYALLRIARTAPTARVVFLPSDHYVSDDGAFMAHVEAAFEAVAARPDLVVLLGVAADGPEPHYGWIEPGHAIGTPRAERVSRIRRFWEKPPPALAEELWTRGCVWNSFVMVGGVPTLLSLMRQALPELWDAFATAGPAIGTPREDEMIRELYATRSPVNFSREVLATRPANLGVLRVSGVDWCDWGAPDRVLATLTRRGIQPDWAAAVAEPA